MIIPYKLKSIKLVLTTLTLILVTFICLRVIHITLDYIQRFYLIYQQDPHAFQLLSTITRMFDILQSVLIGFGSTVVAILGLYSGANIFVKRKFGGSLIGNNNHHGGGDQFTQDRLNKIQDTLYTQKTKVRRLQRWFDNLFKTTKDFKQDE